MVVVEGGLVDDAFKRASNWQVWCTVFTRVCPPRSAGFGCAFEHPDCKQTATSPVVRQKVNSTDLG
jgi:hypothetical protein